jgi:hypothetical protein
MRTQRAVWVHQLEYFVSRSFDPLQVDLRLCDVPGMHWMTRQVRICERDETTRYRVFECVRCHTEVMWKPGVQLSEKVARAKTIPICLPGVE